MKRWWLIFCFLYSSGTWAQPAPRPAAIVSGPMPGQVELRTARSLVQDRIYANCIIGKKNERVLTVAFRVVDVNKPGTWSISEKQLIP